MPTLALSNFRALRRVRWDIPRGVSLLIGANGAGKTTLIRSLRLLRTTYERGLSEAVAAVMGGAQGIAFRGPGSNDEDLVTLELSDGDLRWGMHLTAGISDASIEWLFRGNAQRIGRNIHGEIRFHGMNVPVAEDEDRAALRRVFDLHPEDQEVRRMHEMLRGITVFYETDLTMLRRYGSRSSDDRYLMPQATNAFTMLRRWHERRPERYRYDFVLETLRSAFPDVIADLDFDVTDQSIGVRFYKPGDDASIPHRLEANGVLAMLVLCCELASAFRGGIVAIDEPENALHPYAIRMFKEAAEAWAHRNDLHVILTTHSPVLISEFKAQPENIFVLDEYQPAGQYPRKLTDLRDREWLSNFILGDLYALGEFGQSPDFARQ